MTPCGEKGGSSLESWHPRKIQKLGGIGSIGLAPQKLAIIKRLRLQASWTCRATYRFATSLSTFWWVHYRSSYFSLSSPPDRIWTPLYAVPNAEGYFPGIQVIFSMPFTFETLSSSGSSLASFRKAQLFSSAAGGLKPLQFSKTQTGAMNFPGKYTANQPHSECVLSNHAWRLDSSNRRSRQKLITSFTPFDLIHHLFYTSQLLQLVGRYG